MKKLVPNIILNIGNRLHVPTTAPLYRCFNTCYEILNLYDRIQHHFCLVLSGRPNQLHPGLPSKFEDTLTKGFGSLWAFWNQVIVDPNKVSWTTNSSCMLHSFFWHLIFSKLLKLFISDFTIQNTNFVFRILQSKIQNFAL